MRELALIGTGESGSERESRQENDKHQLLSIHCRIKFSEVSKIAHLKNVQISIILVNFDINSLTSWLAHNCDATEGEPEKLNFLLRICIN